MKFLSLLSISLFLYSPHFAEAFGKRSAPVDKRPAPNDDRHGHGPMRPRGEVFVAHPYQVYFTCDAAMVKRRLQQTADYECYSYHAKRVGNWEIGPCLAGYQDRCVEGRDGEQICVPEYKEQRSGHAKFRCL